MQSNLNDRDFSFSVEIIANPVKLLSLIVDRIIFYGFHFIDTSLDSLSNHWGNKRQSQFTAQVPITAKYRILKIFNPKLLFLFLSDLID